MTGKATPDPMTAEERKARERKRRKTQRSRKQWRANLTWRGERMQPLSWYLLIVSLGIGAFWGIVGTPDHRGDVAPAVVFGALAIGLVFSTILYACLPALIAHVVLFAGLIVGAVTLSPSFPGSVSPGIMGVVGGILVGAAIRWVLVGRRMPADTRKPFAPRKLTRRSTRIEGNKRRDFFWTIGGAVAALVFAAVAFYGGGGRVLDYAILTALAFLWAIPTGRVTYLANAGQIRLGTAANVGLWGIIFGGFAAAGCGFPFVFWFFTSVAGLSIGLIVSQLLTVRRVRLESAPPEGAKA